jgi:PAS domain S-box-containing protein
MWEKILLNLLSNAFKFTFEGAIRVRLRDRGTSVELDVEDTGTGIAEHDLPRLFERFHRIEGARSRSYEGSGIGLALVQELVRMHGGTARVRSELGLGTTFTVSIPYGTHHLPADRLRGERTLASTALGPAPYVEQALRWLHDDASPAGDLVAPPGVSHRPVLGTAMPGSSTRPSIAIVDDNADMRAYLARVLSECGDARTYADGRAALAGIRARPPDLVVTDVMMPNVDGFGLLQALRGDATTQAIPVIMLSARAGEEARIEGVRAGADDYIVKPFSARELVARVGAQLGLARLRGVAAAERAALHRLYMDAPAAIAIVSGPEHVYELANPLYCKIVGRSVEQLIGRSGRDAMPEFVPQGIWDLFDRIRATGERFRAATFPTEIHRDGRLTRSFFNWLGEPSFDDTGQVARILIFAVDVTEEVVARERAEQLTAELQRANRTKDEFFAMLGHELRNPLAPISTALRVMELRGVQGGERERAVIGRQVDHLTRLVDDLLDISRITTGKVQLASAVVEMADIVTGAIEVTSPMLEQRTQRLRMVVPRPGLAVCVDTARMTQVVSNLLVNASKYSDPGTEIRISAALEHDEVVLHVDDAGIGIDPEMLPRVFDVFSQEQQTLARSSGGLGLGLAIVRSLVTMHGGNVSAHSAGRGKGATFTVRLPHAAQHVSALAGASELAGPAPQRASARRILIVDDNPDASAMLSDLLGALGHVIQTAHDGPSALALLDAFRPEIALLDLGLPVMDGYELARAMRASPAAAGARLYAVSGYGQERDRARTKDAGFDAHFVKPVDLDAIVRAFEQPDH